MHIIKTSLLITSNVKYLILLFVYRIFAFCKRNKDYINKHFICFKGNRGFLYEVWKDTATVPDSVSSLPSTADDYVSRVVLDSENPREGLGASSRHSARLRGYFIPPVNSSYRFHLICQGSGILYLSKDSDANNKVNLCFLEIYWSIGLAREIHIV